MQWKATRFCRQTWFFFNKHSTKRFLFLTKKSQKYTEEGCEATKATPAMASFSVLPRLRGIKILSACLLYLVDSLPSTVLAPFGRLRQPLPSGPAARLPSFLFPQSLRGRTGIGSFPEECLWAACGSLLPWPGCARPSRKRGRSAPSNLFAEAYAGGWESMALCQGLGRTAPPPSPVAGLRPALP